MKTTNLPLIVGIALPFIIIIIVAVILFVPALTIKPAYNFLYTAEGSYAYGNQEYKNTYKVENGHLYLRPVPVNQTDTYSRYIRDENPTLYLYDVKNNYSHEVSYQEAKDFNIDPGPTSPDGYIVKYEYSNRGIFEIFGSDGDHNGYYIARDGAKKKLGNLGIGQYWGSGSLRFIGWIK